MAFPTSAGARRQYGDRIRRQCLTFGISWAHDPTPSSAPDPDGRWPNRVKAITRGWDPERERRLSVLPDTRSLCRRGGKIPSCGQTRPREGHRTKRREGCGLSRHGWHDHAAIRRLHAHGMLGGLEHGRADMGLPVSWVALQADRRRDLRAGRGATPKSGRRPALDYAVAGSRTYADVNAVVGGIPATSEAQAATHPRGRCAMQRDTF